MFSFVTQLTRLIRTNPVFIIISGLILLIAGYLRFFGLREQGILGYDEAWYMLVAQTYCLLPKFLGMVISGTDSQAAFAELYSWGIFTQISFKPGYQVFLILAKFLTGITNPASAAYLSATFGMVCVILTGWIVYQHTDSRCWALVGALTTATSGFMVRYSRLGGPYSAAAFILLLYILVYQRRLKATLLTGKQQFWLGALLGSTITFYDTLVPVAGILGLAEVGVLWAREKKNGLKKSFIFVLGCLSPILFWEIVTLALRKVFHWTLHKGYVIPYFKQVIKHVSNNPVRAEHFTQTQVDYAYFLKIFSVTDGAVFPFIVILGLLLLLFATLRSKFRNVSLGFMTGLSWLIAILMAIYPDKVARMASPFFPVFILASILGLWTLSSQMKPDCKYFTALQKIGVSAIIAIMAFSGISYSYDLLTVRSAYPAAAQKIRELLKPGELMAGTLMHPIYTAYLQEKVPHFYTVKDLQKVMSQHNIRYIVFDMQNLTTISKFCQPSSLICPYSDKWKEMDAIENYIRRVSVRRWQIANPIFKDFQFYWEDHMPLEYAKYLLGHSDETFYGYTRIYEVPSGFNPDDIKISDSNSK